jgi:creatinine amidohydrolase/Fe(II)-dependent formamide hydrolase-like protein
MQVAYSASWSTSSQVILGHGEESSALLRAMQPCIMRYSVEYAMENVTEGMEYSCKALHAGPFFLSKSLAISSASLEVSGSQKALFFIQNII